MKSNATYLMCTLCIAVILAGVAQADLVAHLKLEDDLTQSLTVVNSVTDSGFGNGWVLSNYLINSGIEGKFGNAFNIPYTSTGSNRGRVATSYKLSADGDWTLAGWYRSTDTNTGRQGNIMAVYSDPLAAGYSNLFFYGASGSTTAGYNGRGRLSVGGVRSLYSEAVLTDGQWHFRVGTREGDTFTFYVDGVYQDSETVEGILINQGSNLCIGNLTTVTSGTTKNGDLDEVRVYNHALSAAEVAALYAIPEPASLVLLGLGGLVFFAKRRRA